MTPHRLGSLNKSARLIILSRMQHDGTLRSMTHKRRAELLGVSMSTMFRDMVDLERLQPVIDAYLDKAKESPR
jgi:hypothetical protein